MNGSAPFLVDQRRILEADHSQSTSQKKDDHHDKDHTNDTAGQIAVVVIAPAGYRAYEEEDQDDQQESSDIHADLLSRQNEEFIVESHEVESEFAGS
jgi:hypothetical protein